MMAVMNGYVYYTLDRRPGPKEGATWCSKYGPFICTMIAAPLVLADQTRHVTQDLGWWAPVRASGGLVIFPMIIRAGF